MTTAFESFVRQLAQHLHLDPQALASNQELVIEDFEVGFLHEPAEDDALAPEGDFVFFSRLAAPAPAYAAAVHTALLEANSLWLGTAGFTLGLHSGSGDILLCGRVPLERGVTPHVFMPILQRFVATAFLWRGYLDGSLRPGEQTTDAPGLAGSTWVVGSAA